MHTGKVLVMMRTRKKYFAMDEYKNNVSKADIILMHAASYSDY